MTPEQTSFVELCTQLRLLGATDVTCGELAAKFAGAARIVPPPAPATTQEPLTDEQAREKRYAEELGRVIPPRP